jgi:hypothetical protein
MAPSAFSSAAVLAGLIACFYATHRFGRLGADEGGSTASAVDAVRAPTASDVADPAEDAEEAARLRKAREDARARAKRGE